MKYTLTLKYYGINPYLIEDDNISKFIEKLVNVFDDLYLKNSDFKNSIEKKFQIDYQVVKNKKKVPFGFLSEEIIKNLNRDEIKELIKTMHTINSGISGELKISNSNNFFMYSGTTNTALKNIYATLEKIIKEISNLEITFNSKIYINKEDNNMDEKFQKNFYNKLLFGPTGTGKSRLAETLARQITKNKNENILRVTFHPEFDYCDFFGQYKPVVYESDSGSTTVFSPYNQEKMQVPNSYVTYSFTYGIFLESVLKALSKENEEVVLLIEEINRGNCAAIFGDLLQLLDRDDLGISKYELSLNIDMKRYLVSLKNIADKNPKQEVIKGINNSDLENALHNLLSKERLYIPGNLTIIGTMNNSDQSLYPMDSAFKRRWDMEYIAIDYNQNKILIEKSKTSWNDFLSLINHIIIKELRSEDKTIGQWFIIPKNNQIMESDIKNKLISYLYFDVFKHYDGIFGDLSYSELLLLSIDEIVTILENNKLDRNKE